MKLAYLVLAHNNPKHFTRLVRAISGSDNQVFVHIDRKSDITPFLLSESGVEYVPNRVSVFWGDYTQVEAILELMRFALSKQASFDHLILLSGGDYPLQSQKYIHDFFARNIGHEFIQMIPMPCNEGGKPITRLTHYHLRNSDPPAYNAWLKLKLNLGLMPKERDYWQVLGEYKPYGGATWWALTESACRHIVDFIDTYPQIAEFYKNTDCPDESLFHTILGNSEFAAKLKPSITYTDWSKGGANPSPISERHLDFFSRSPVIPASTSFVEKGEVLFARKFSDGSTAVLDKLDAMIGSRA